MQEPEVYERIQLKLHEIEPPTLENISNTDTPDQSLSFIDQDQQCPSTRILKLAENEHILRPFYRLNSQILRRGPITETMRAKLRSFLMEECSKQSLLRETYALACTLADLFFAHGGTVSTGDYQSLQLACLILATKIKEGKFPTISFQTFSREQLMGFEIQVAMRLSYQLTPPTYHDYAERIVFLWDAYTQQEGLCNIQISQDKIGVNQPLRMFYEQLDCIFMVLRSLDYDIEDLVVNLFYMNARKMNVEMLEPTILTPQELELHFYPQNDKFRSFFQSFLQIYSKKTFLLNPRTGAYLKHFLNVKTSQSKWSFSCNNEAVDNMRRWDKLQSVPQGNYPLAKTIIQKNNRSQL